MGATYHTVKAYCDFIPSAKGGIGDIVLRVHREWEKGHPNGRLLPWDDPTEIGARDFLDRTLYKAMPAKAFKQNDSSIKKLAASYLESVVGYRDVVVSSVRDWLGVEDRSGKPSRQADMWAGTVPHNWCWKESDGNGGEVQFHDYEGPVAGEEEWERILDQLRGYGIEVVEGTGPHSHPEDAAFFLLPNKREPGHFRASQRE